MGKQEAKVIGAVLGIVLVIIVVMLLLPSGETVDPNHNNTTKPGENTSGQWSIGDKREEPTQKPEVITPGTITFFGYDDYTVSPSSKDIELTNPEKNEVNFVFTITDAQTGEEIATTGTVAPGKYAYVNVFDHYSQAGEYDVIIGISAFSFTGQQLNGVNSDAVITVVNT